MKTAFSAAATEKYKVNKLNGKGPNAEILHWVLFIVYLLFIRLLSQSLRHMPAAQLRQADLRRKWTLGHR